MSPYWWFFTDAESPVYLYRSLFSLLSLLVKKKKNADRIEIMFVYLLRNVLPLRWIIIIKKKKENGINEMCGRRISNGYNLKITEHISFPRSGIMQTFKEGKFVFWDTWFIRVPFLILQSKIVLFLIHLQFKNKMVIYIHTVRGIY